MQKHTPHILSLLGTALLLLSCTKTEVRQADGSDAITFTNIGTKAPVESKDDIKSFSVWGWYADDAAGNPSVVFDNTKVYEKDAAWTYDGLQFWQSGKTYDFYALYPDTATLTTPDQSGKKAAESAAYDAAGNLTITDFDSTSGHDLMTASRTGMPGDNPQPVAFTFSHELSRLSFKLESDNITVTSAKLYGVHYLGNLVKEYVDNSWKTMWIFDEPIDEVSTPFVTANSLTPENGVITLFTDMLLPPHTGTNPLADAKLSIVYNSNNSTQEQNVIFNLEDASVKEWSAGSSYSYTATVSVNPELTVTVTGWQVQDTVVEW